MIIGCPKDIDSKETRIAITPAIAKKFLQLGAQLIMSSDLGNPIGVNDQDYEALGVKTLNDPSEILRNADIILRLGKPTDQDILLMKPHSTYVGLLDPFNQIDMIKHFAHQQVSAIAMELIPRTTIAQRMDALSSQASLAGYAAVLLAAQRVQKIFPMQMTPAGTIAPIKVFVIGAGVAGLQAIATAKRLGARVEAFDPRPSVGEQVQSLGAQFIKIDLGPTEQTKDGYAKALTNEQLHKQRQEMAKACARADIVITTAQVFGKKAPLLITKDMISAMKPLSVIVDMAIESGGNVEGSVLDQETIIHGVKILAFSRLASYVNKDASEMYANNLYNLIEHTWDRTDQQFRIDPTDDILKNCLVTHQGHIVHPQINDLLHR